MWPERTAAEGGGPLLTEEGPYMHSLQHPIPDARTALPVEPLAEVMSEVLRCNSVDDLVLVHQNFRRTDPSPGPHPPFIGEGRLDGTQLSAATYGVGVDRDGAEAVRLYARSAAQGYTKAELCLGIVYEKGDGVAKDEAEAAKWYARAAAKGDERAKAALAANPNMPDASTMI